MTPSLTFKPTSDSSYTVVLFGILSFVFGWTCFAALNPAWELPMLWIIFPVLIFAVYLLILPNRINYQIKGDFLICWNGKFKRKIQLDSIKEVEQVKAWSNFGFLFSSATSGIKIRYGRFGRVTLNPENTQEFLSELQNRNEEIEVI